MTHRQAVAVAAVFVVLALAVGVGTAAAQPGITEDFNKTFGADADLASTVVQTSDGGYAITGPTNLSDTDRESFLIETDSGGNVEFERTLEGSAAEVVQTSDGGYALAGGIGPIPEQDLFFLKTDQNGNVEINKTFGGSDTDFANAVAQTSDGGYAVVGNTESFGTNDGWFIKMDSNGNVEIDKKFGGPGINEPRSVVQTSDGGYAFAGRILSGGPDDDGWLVKTDSDGDIEFKKTFGGSDEDSTRSVIQTLDGGYVLTGRASSFGSGGRDGWLIKTDANGNEQFNETYGGSGSDEAFRLDATSDGGYALAGLTESFGSGGRDAWFIKTDANGNQEFSETFGGSDSDTVYSVAQTSDGGYALAGFTESFGSGGSNAWLIRLSDDDSPTPANFEVSIDGTNAPVEEGETLNITGTIENTGGQQDTQDITASASGLGSLTRTVTLDAGESRTETVSVPTNTGDSGTYTVTVESENDTATTTVEVESDGGDDTFTDPLPGFNNPPQNTGEIDPTLYEDIDGDGDGTDPTQAVTLWTQLIINEDEFDDLTQEQVDALDWDGDGQLTPADAVSLWTEQVLA